MRPKQFISLTAAALVALSATFSTYPVLAASDPASEQPQPSVESSEPLPLSTPLDETPPSSESASGALDETQPSSNSASASSDEVQPSSDSTSASPDEAQPSSDSVSASPDEAQPSSDSVSASPDEAQPISNSTQPINLALNKTSEDFIVDMTGAGSDLDPATKDTTIRDKENQIVGRLTDGIYGNGAILDGNWNESGERSKYYEAYRQIDRTLVLDLGQLSHITTLNLHMQEHLKYGISIPSTVSYFLSEDGVDYRRVGQVSRFDAQLDTNPDHNAADPDCQNYNFQLQDLDYNARYVKLSFELSGTWAFADELEVLGSLEPSSSPQPLPDTPGTDYEEVGEYAWTDQSRGIQHETLAYAGHWISSAGGALQTSEKSVEQLLPVVGYVDEEGNVTDTFFQSVTFLSHGYTPNLDTPDDPSDYHRLIYSSAEMTGNPQAAELAANKQDWQTWLDFLFDFDDGKGGVYNLDALEQAVGQVKQAIGDDTYTVGVKIAFYPPLLCQNDWGTLPGIDHSLNFCVSEDNPKEQALADRLAASKWYIDTVVQRFAEKGYKNIRLDGFYWYDEVMYYNLDPLVTETVQGVTSYVHSLQNGAYQIYWIPFYQSSGFRSWKEFGFDYAIMQPNYAFDAAASADRIKDTAELCKRFGLGVEMEFGGISDKYISQFREYLRQGADDQLGYQNNSLIAWYTGTWAIHETSQNKDDTRYIYDAMYDFFRGIPTSMEKPNKNLAADGKLTLQAEQIANQEAFDGLKLDTLVDGSQKTGIWAQYLQINRSNIAQGPFVLTSDLEGIGKIEQIALDFAENTGWGIGAPDTVTYRCSSDGVNWTELGQVSRSQAERTELASGFSAMEYTLKLDTPVASRYISAVFDHGTNPEKQAPYAWLGMDEFTLLGSAPLASGEGIASLGTVTLTADNILPGQEETFAQRQAVAAKLLNNGTLQTGSWSNVNTEQGDYVGLLQTVTTGPYQVQLSFDTIAEVDRLGMDFLHWASAGVGSPEKVVYFTSLDGETWTECGTVTKEQAKHFAGIATGMDGYHFVLEFETPQRVKYVKACFEQGYNPDKDAPWGWIAFDEFTVEGTLTSEQPSPAFSQTVQGVTLQAGPDIVPQGAQLQVECLESGKPGYETIKAALQVETNTFAGYRIQLMLNGQEIQPKGTVTLSLPVLKTSAAKQQTVYLIQNEQNKQDMGASPDKDALKISASQLGLYAVAGPDAVPTSSPAPTSTPAPNTTPAPNPTAAPSQPGSSSGSPATGDNGLNGIVCVLLGSAAGFAFVQYIRRKRNA